MSAAERDFAARLIRWHKRHGRHDLPWQNTRDPYRVWLSEIMLQQTQVATVIPYYLRFLERFPTLETLASAPVGDVMALWSGLGYYARARNLHACAWRVMDEHGGQFPQDPQAIAALPGIGRSTANSIATFCFGARAPILDGNAKRVLCRAFGIEGFPGSGAVEKQLWALAEELMPSRDGATYNQAQMDLGSTVCTRSKPRCDTCPLCDACVAKAQGRQADLPQGRPLRVLPMREATFLVVWDGERVLLEARPPQGIWGGLLCLPELPADVSPDAYLAARGLASTEIVATEPLLHVFSHFRLRMLPLLCTVNADTGVAEGGRVWLPIGAIAAAALPTPVRKILSNMQAPRSGPR